MATDLRASSSLVLAGLIAAAHYHSRRGYHIDRVTSASRTIFPRAAGNFLSGD